MDRGAWRATVHRIAKSWTQLSTCAQGCFILLSSRNEHNIVKQLHTNKKILKEIKIQKQHVLLTFSFPEDCSQLLVSTPDL